jgi:hypothetical protein
MSIVVTSIEGKTNRQHDHIQVDQIKREEKKKEEEERRKKKKKDTDLRRRVIFTNKLKKWFSLVFQDLFIHI